MMVGDEAACRRAFDDLQERAARLLLEDASLAGGPAAPALRDRWQELVPRFRALRESVTSNQDLGGFSAAVYEASADACLRAGDWGELLKCLNQLVSVHYPAVAAGAAPGSMAAAAAGAAGWPAAAARSLIFFACVPPGGADLLEVQTLARRLPGALLATPEVRVALRVVAAVAAGDYVAFFRTRREEGAKLPGLALLMEPRAQQVRARGMCAMASAYRQIPAGAARAMLGIEDGDAGTGVGAGAGEGADGATGGPLETALAAAAARVPAAARALEALEPGAATIVFKA